MVARVAGLGGGVEAALQARDQVAQHRAARRQLRRRAESGEARLGRRRHGARGEHRVDQLAHHRHLVRLRLRAGLGLGIVSTSRRTIAAYHVHSYREEDGHR